MVSAVEIRDPALRIVRSRLLMLAWDAENQLVATLPESGRQFAISSNVVRILDEAASPISAGDLRERAGATFEALSTLLDVGLLKDVRCEIETADWWTPAELVVLRMTGSGRARPELDVDTMPPSAKPLSRDLAVRFSTEIGEELQVLELMARRRSCRHFSGRALSLSDLGLVLCATSAEQDADRKNGISYRPTPSGGARHPLEIYVLSRNVQSLDEGVYRFVPGSPGLEPLKAPDDRFDLIFRQAIFATGGESPGPPLLLLITAVFGRTMWKYEGMGLATIFKDVGCLFHSLYLACTAVGLGACAIGGGPEFANATWLGLDPNVESQVGLFMLGWPAE